MSNPISNNKPKYPGILRIAPANKGLAGPGAKGPFVRYEPILGQQVRFECPRDKLLGAVAGSPATEFLLARVSTLTVLNAELADLLRSSTEEFKADLSVVNQASRSADLKGDPAQVEALGIKSGQWLLVSAKGPDGAAALKRLQSLLVDEFKMVEIVENTALREMGFPGRSITSNIKIGRALVLKDTLDLNEFPVVDLQVEAIKHNRSLDEELAAHLNATADAIREVEETLDQAVAQAQASGHAEELRVAEALAFMFNGIEGLGAMKQELLELMESKKVCAAAAVREYIGRYEANKQSSDPKFQALFTDIYQLGVKLLAIKHKKSVNIREEIEASKLGEHIMLVAENIAASDSGVIADRRIDGAVREKGAPKDHLSIRLRDHEKVGLYGTRGVTAAVHTGDLVIVDGRRGLIIINPSEVTTQHYERLKTEYDRLDGFLKTQRQLEPVTADGVRLELTGNAAAVDDIESALNRHNLAGIALVRTEYFFCEHPDLSERTAEPSVEEQRKYYDRLILAAGDRTVVIRTVDIDPDKTFPYLEKPVEIAKTERKKGLGLCLDKENNIPYYFLFRDQLKALLQTKGRARVMFPLVRSDKEYETALALVEAIKQELRSGGKTVNEQLSFGAMIEHPDILKDLPKRAEFFSLGTTDLTQFVTAVNRYSTLNAGSFDELDPRVLKEIAKAVAKAAEADKPLSCCGDMGNDWRGMLTLMALGVRKFSVSTGVSDLMRFIVRSVKIADLQAMLKGLHGIRTPGEARHFIEEYTREQIRSGAWAELKKVETLLFLDETAT